MTGGGPNQTRQGRGKVNARVMSANRHTLRSAYPLKERLAEDNTIPFVFNFQTTGRPAERSIGCVPAYAISIWLSSELAVIKSYAFMRRPGR
jgi:hypothetical protein